MYFIWYVQPPGENKKASNQQQLHCFHVLHNCISLEFLWSSIFHLNIIINISRMFMSLQSSSLQNQRQARTRSWNFQLLVSHAICQANCTKIFTKLNCLRKSFLKDVSSFESAKGGLNWGDASLGRVEWELSQNQQNTRSRLMSTIFVKPPFETALQLRVHQAPRRHLYLKQHNRPISNQYDKQQGICCKKKTV